MPAKQWCPGAGTRGRNHYAYGIGVTIAITADCPKCGRRVTLNRRQEVPRHMERKVSGG